MSQVNADHATIKPVDPAAAEAWHSEMAARSFLDNVVARRDNLLDSLAQRAAVEANDTLTTAEAVNAGVLSVLEVLDGKDGGAGYMAAIRPAEGKDMDYNPVDLGSDLSELWLSINA